MTCFTWDRWVGDFWNIAPSCLYWNDWPFSALVSMFNALNFQPTKMNNRIFCLTFIRRANPPSCRLISSEYALRYWFFEKSSQRPSLHNHLFLESLDMSQYTYSLTSIRIHNREPSQFLLSAYIANMLLLGPIGLGICEDSRGTNMAPTLSLENFVTIGCWSA